jgi:hypothetical protein
VRSESCRIDGDARRHSSSIRELRRRCGSRAIHRSGRRPYMARWYAAAGMVRRPHDSEHRCDGLDVEVLQRASAPTDYDELPVTLNSRSRSDSSLRLSNVQPLVQHLDTSELAIGGEGQLDQRARCVTHHSYSVPGLIDGLANERKQAGVATALPNHLLTGGVE